MNLSKIKIPFSIYLIFTLGCFATLSIIKLNLLDSIGACCLASLAFTFLPLPKFLDTKEMQIVFYTGSFVGMSNSSLLFNFFNFFCICLFGTFFYILLQHHFKGTGGKLGTIAFLSVTSFILLRSIL